MASLGSGHAGLQLPNNKRCVNVVCVHGIVDARLPRRPRLQKLFAYLVRHSRKATARRPVGESLRSGCDRVHLRALRSRAGAIDEPAKQRNRRNTPAAPENRSRDPQLRARSRARIFRVFSRRTWRLKWPSSRHSIAISPKNSWRPNRARWNCDFATMTSYARPLVRTPRRAAARPEPACEQQYAVRFHFLIVLA